MSKILTYLFLPILLLFSAFTHQNTSEILWGQRLIQWDDFKGRPEMRGKYVASLSSSIQVAGRFVNRDSVVYEVKASMNTQKSWVAIKSDTLLQHERCHFDITEMYARKLRKEMLKRRFSAATLNKEVSKLFRKMNEERNQMQILYDEETNHSIHYQKQLAWEKKIAQALLELEGFKQVEVPFKLW